MTVYSIEDLLQMTLETYPDYDMSSRLITYTRFLREALRKVQTVKERELVTGYKLTIDEINEAKLPNNLYRLLNVYEVKGNISYPFEHKVSGNKLQFYIANCNCLDIRISYYSNADDFAFSDDQKNYAIHYALEKILRNDLFGNPSLMSFYQMTVAERDSSFAGATRIILSRDDIQKAITAYRTGKYHVHSNNVGTNPF